MGPNGCALMGWALMGPWALMGWAAKGRALMCRHSLVGPLGPPGL